MVCHSENESGSFYNNILRVFRFIHYFRPMKSNKFGPAIIVSIIIFFGVVAWMSTMRYELVIPGKTNALYSLESAWSKQRVTEVISYWEAAGKKETAWKLNSIDFLLVLGYCPFLFFSIRFLARLFPSFYENKLKVLSILIILAGIFDILEGVASYFWLNGTVDTISPFIIGITAFTKFLIIIPMTILVLAGFVTALFRRRINHGLEA